MYDCKVPLYKVADFVQFGKKNAIIISSRVHSTNTKLNTGNLNIPLNHQLFYYSLKTIRKSSTLQTSNHLYKLNLNLTGETNQI